jgi:plasmid stabilization system protein ParE
MIPEFPELPHREVVIRPYRFFYRVEKKTIWIVAVWHGAQETKDPSGSA